MSKVIYIEKDENAEDVAGHISAVSDRNCILIVPKQAEIFNDPVNLEQLKNKADNLKKHLTLITLDVGGRLMAERVGITVSKPKSGEQGLLEHPLLNEKNKKRNKVLGELWQTLAVPKRMSVLKKLIYSALTLILIFAVSVALLYSVFARTDIYIKTNSESYSSNLEIVISVRVLSEGEVSGQLQVPGRMVRKTLEAKDQFPATGKKNFGEKASGIVTFYNYGEDTIIINGSDTLLKAGNLVYKLNAEILRIRPTAHIGLDNKKIDPTSLIPPQPIVAEAAGEQFNLLANTQFEIFNSKMNSSPQLFYAVNSSKISGGSIKEITVVDANDLDNADKVLRGRLDNSAITELEKTLKSGEKIVQDKVELINVDRTFEPTIGSETVFFDMKIIADVIGLAYNQDMVNELVRKNVVGGVPAGKKLANDSHVVSLSLKSLDLDNSRAVIVNDYKGAVYPDYDNADIKYSLRGKSADEILNYFKNKPEAQTVRAQFYPSWLKYASLLSGRIYIHLN